MKNQLPRRIALILSAIALAACDPAGEIGTRGDPQKAVARAMANIQAHPDLVAANADHGFVLRDVVLDPDGREHVRFDRLYKGLRVLGGDLVMHGRSDGSLDSVSLAFPSKIVLQTQPSLTELEAATRARAAFSGASVSPGAAELVVYADEGIAQLAYEVVLSGLLADGTPSELHVVVDAASGLNLAQWDGIETAAGNGHGFFDGTVTLNTTFSGGTYSLKDPTRGNQSTNDMNNGTNGNGTLFVSATDVWGDGTLANRATVAVDAQYGAALTWDYYLNVHGRNGIANDGVGAVSRVHYNNNYSNAFWSDNCFCMTYGDGDGTTFYPFPSIDVAGHEMSHGVTSRTARLAYHGESGGLNEATSDIFGTMVEFYANDPNDTPDYLIGEKIFVVNGNQATTPNNGEAIRYMFNPEQDGRSASCYSRTVKRLDVHFSSGVANHFFYLLAEGTTPITHTCGQNLSFAGLGRSAAERIWYRALTVYMTSRTNYSAARAATLQAAADLALSTTAVANAWSAVLVQ